jgi:hypothetical protein
MHRHDHLSSILSERVQLKEQGMIERLSPLSPALSREEQEAKRASRTGSIFT